MSRIGKIARRTFLIGGVAANFTTTARLGTGDYFVIEEIVGWHIETIRCMCISGGEIKRSYGVFESWRHLNFDV